MKRLADFDGALSELRRTFVGPMTIQVRMTTDLNTTKFTYIRLTDIFLILTF